MSFSGSGWLVDAGFVSERERVHVMAGFLFGRKIGKLFMKQLLPHVGSFSGNVGAPAELGGESDCILSKVPAVINVHEFDKNVAVFSDFYHMSKASNCLYTKK